MTHPLQIEDIRPRATMAAQEEALKQDRAWFAERKDRLIRCPCPACGLTEGIFRWERDGMRWHRCPQCRTYYVDPRPTQALLQVFLLQSARYRHFQEAIFPTSEDARRDRICAPRLAKIRWLCERHDVPRRFLVEIGAGFGTFAALARGFFGRVAVVEPVPDLAGHCRGRGLEVLGEDLFENVAVHDGASVVAAFEVLEHAAWPWVFVRACMQALEPGGLLVLTCPNGRGFDAELLGREATAFALGHLTLFNPNSINHLLWRAGFEVLEIQTPGKLDAELVREAALAGRFDLDDHPLLRRILIDGWPDLAARFQSFLADNLLSSHMWAVARKPKGAEHVG